MAFACILFYLGVKNIGLVVTSIGSILNLLFPFILGAAIAFVINVPMSRIEYWLFRRTDKLKRGRRPISFIVTLALVVGLIVIAMYIVIPQLAETLQTIATQLPDAYKALQDWIYSKMSYWKALQDLSQKLAVNWEEIIQKISVLLQDAAGAMVNSGIGAVTNIIGAVVNFFIGFVFAIYILMAKETLAGQGKQILYALFKEERAEKILYVCTLANRTFSKFISGPVPGRLYSGYHVLHRHDHRQDAVRHADRRFDRFYGADPHGGRFYRVRHRSAADPHGQPGEGPGLRDHVPGAAAGGREPGVSSYRRQFRGTAVHLGAGGDHHRRQSDGRRGNDPVYPALLGAVRPVPSLRQGTAETKGYSSGKVGGAVQSDGECDDPKLRFI